MFYGSSDKRIGFQTEVFIFSMSHKLKNSNLWIGCSMGKSYNLIYVVNLQQQGIFNSEE